MEENKENRIAVKTALPSYITSEMHDELSNFSGSSSFAALRRGSFTEMATIHSAQLSEDNYTYDSHEMPDKGDGVSEIKESTRIPQVRILVCILFQLDLKIPNMWSIMQRENIIQMEMNGSWGKCTSLCALGEHTGIVRVSSGVKLGNIHFT